MFKKILLVAVIVGIISAQFFYDEEKSKIPEPEFSTSLQFVKTFDLGLHSATASFLWIGTRSEIPFMIDVTPQEFDNDLRLVNDLDPKFAAPYVYTLEALPSAKKYPDRVRAAIAVGERGILNSDPDWRIPFYLGFLYRFGLKNYEESDKYFDLTMKTPGVPGNVKVFLGDFLEKASQ